MKAISIRGAWAHMIIHSPWHKDIENRNWYRDYRGPLLIHMGKGWKREEQSECAAFCESRGLPAPPPMSDLQRGGIIGRVDVVGWVKSFNSPWFVGHYGLVLANPQPLDFIPCQGQLDLFDVDLDALEIA